MRAWSWSGPTRATCSPSTPAASPLWQAKVSSEVSGPPNADGDHADRLVDRRQDFRPGAAGRQPEMGISARHSAAHRAPFRRRRRSPAAACSPAPRAASCWRSMCRRATWPGKAMSRRPRAQPSSSASPTSPACRSSTSAQVCAVAYQGRARLLRPAARHADLVARFRQPGRPRPGQPLPLHHRRQGRDPGAGQDHRRIGVEAGQACQRAPSGPVVVGDYLGGGRRRGLSAPARPQRRQPRRPSRDRRHRRAGATGGFRRTRWCGRALGGNADQHIDPVSAGRDARLPMLPTLVLVGRPNVGKSTLFNRLTRSRAALVADFPGSPATATTAAAAGATGPTSSSTPAASSRWPSDGIMHEMAAQTRPAIAEADVVVFLVDGRDGLTGAGPDHRRRAAPIRPRRWCWRSTSPRAWRRSGSRPSSTSWRWASRCRSPLRTARTCASWSSTRSSNARRAGGRDREPADEERQAHQGGDRRPAQRRQVDAGQHAAGRGARDRLRRAGHDARFDLSRLRARRHAATR